MLHVFTFEHWTVSGGFKIFFLFLNNVWRTEKFSEYKHFCFYWVYVFKTAIWLTLNKQASKYTVLGNLDHYCVCDKCIMCVSNSVQTDWISCQARKYKTCAVWWESRLGRFLESCTNLPLTLQQVSDLEKEAEEGKSNLAPRLRCGTILALDMKQRLTFRSWVSLVPGSGKWE